MTKKTVSPPNTILGEVHWYHDMHFGTFQWMCQDMLGMGDPKHEDKDFLNPDKHSVDDLREFFVDVRPSRSDGKLAFDLYTDTTYQTVALCMIETTLPHNTILTDQELLNLIADFKEHVRGLPLAKIGDGKLILDPNEPGYSDPGNQAWLKRVTELNMMLGFAHMAAKEQLRSEGILVTSSFDDEDDIPF